MRAIPQKPAELSNKRLHEQDLRWFAVHTRSKSEKFVQRALEKRRGRVKACELTLKLLDGYQTAHYAQLAQGAANASFIVGWVDTRVQNVPLARCAESVAAATF